MADARNEALPDARLLAGHELVRVSVPAVEIADDAHPLGVGSPDGERRALRIFGDVGSELLVKVAVTALIEEVQVEWRQQRLLDHAGCTTSRIPRSGIRTQSGRLLSS